MKLIEALCQFSNEVIEPISTDKVTIGFLSADKPLTIEAVSGSRVTQEDYSGEQEMAVPFQIRYRTQDDEQAYLMLGILSNALSIASSLTAESDWSLDHIETQPQSYEQGADLAGTSIYALEFTAIINTQKGKY